MPLIQITRSPPLRASSAPHSLRTPGLGEAQKFCRILSTSACRLTVREYWLTLMPLIVAEVSNITSLSCYMRIDVAKVSGRKTESLGYITVRGKKEGKSKGGARWPTVCLSMYSITENIYYSQLSVAILLQPEPISYRIIQGKDCVLSPYVLSYWGLPLPPTCLLLTVNEAHIYFASTVVNTTLQLFSIASEDKDSTSPTWKYIFDLSLNQFKCYPLISISVLDMT
jgi:hypothetical protein